MSYIQSFGGMAVYPLDIQPAQVQLEDVAHALSLKCRFTGHCLFHYSVAQHSLLASQQVTDPMWRLVMLLHDASEAYLPDVAAPVKSAFSVDLGRGPVPFAEVEKEHAAAIFYALGISSLSKWLNSPLMHHIDRAMLATERRDVMAPSAVDWCLKELAYPFHILERPWREVKEEWLHEVRENLSLLRKRLTSCRT